jgi:hypothetical protein
MWISCASASTVASDSELGGGRRSELWRAQKTYRRVDSDWTIDVRGCISRLQDAHLLPPIGAVEVGRRSGRVVLLVDVCVPVSDELAERIRAALAPVPHVIRQRSPSADGRVPGVDYRSS